jgi:hypothetical protein
MNTLKILLVILIISGATSWIDIMAETVEKDMASDNTGEGKVTSGYSGKDEIIVRTDEESIRKGKVLFEKLCTNCHNTEISPPKGNINMTGPGLRGVLKEDILSFSKKPATAGNILNQLNKSFDKMPSFHFLSEDEKLNIIAFLNTL